MTNLEKGEAVLELAGKAYQVKLGTLAMEALQEIFPESHGVPIDVFIKEVFAAVQQQRIRYVRAVLWGMLRRHHPDVTFADVADLLDEVSPDEVVKLMTAFSIAMVPDPRDLKDLGVDSSGNPQKAQAQRKRSVATGGRSTSKRAAQA